MRFGAIISAIAHMALILLTFFALPNPFKKAPVENFVPVELVPIGEITNIAPMPEPQPKEDTPPPEPKKQELAMKEPEPEPEPEVEQEPEDVEDIPAEDEAAPEEVKKEEPKPETPPPTPMVKPVVKPKPPEPKKQAEQKDTSGDEFLDDIAALLDKMPDQDTPKPQEDPIIPPPENAPREGAGNRTDLTMSEKDAFRAQMRKCWTVPAGALASQDLIVTLRVFMNPDGTLARAPELVRSNLFDINTNPYYRTAAESALRAVQRCQPFQMPADKYQTWKVIELNFDPSSMLAQ